jgi:hypothetical protein
MSEPTAQHSPLEKQVTDTAFTALGSADQAVPSKCATSTRDPDVGRPRTQQLADVPQATPVSPSVLDQLGLATMVHEVPA